MSQDPAGTGALDVEVQAVDTIGRAVSQVGLTMPPDAGAAVGALAGYGLSVARRPTVDLRGSRSAWLVSGGSFDLFAADRRGHIPWRLLGRVGVGTLVVGTGPTSPVALMARTGDGGTLRMIELEELSEAQHDRWSHELPAGGGPSAAEAVTRGIDLGLTVIHEFLIEATPPRDAVAFSTGEVVLQAGAAAFVTTGLRWLQLRRGGLLVGGRDELQHGAGDTMTLPAGHWVRCTATASLSVTTTEDLLAGSRLWESIVAAHAVLLRDVHRALAAGEDRAARTISAATAAGVEAMSSAEEILQAAAAPIDGVLAADASLEAPLIAACRLVADDAGLTLSDVPSSDAGVRRPDTVDRIATASGFRTRQIGLVDDWWRDDVGPLLGALTDGSPVALLWRAGRYQAVDPRTGTRQRVTASASTAVGPRATMFYRPLPDGRLGLPTLLRFGLRGSRPDVVRVLAGAFVAFGLGLAVPILTGQILGRLIPDGERDLIAVACAALVVGALASAAFTAISGIAVLRVQGRLDAHLQSAVWDRLLRLPVHFFSRYSTGELASSALAISSIRQVVSIVGATVINSAIQGIVTLGLLFWFSVPLALLATVLLLLHAIVLAVVARRQLRWQKQQIHVRYDLSNMVFHLLRGLPKLRVAAAESFAYQRWAAGFAGSQELLRRVRRNQGLVTVLNAVYQPLSVLILFAALAGSARNSLSLAGSLTFFTAFGVTLAAFAQMAGSLCSALVVIPMFDKLRPTLAEPPEVPRGRSLPGRLTGDLSLRGVSFRYGSEGPATLRDISLSVRAGEFVAIVGPTGSGKSTLLRLLLGFEDPSAGTVLYDGQDLATLDVGAVRRQCGVVLQNAAPFPGSILANIRGHGEYSLDDVWEAARLAGLEDDIRAMPMGIHTEVSSTGGGLSGGQRQRLIIAQALIRRPRMLFFDEATSALDNETQRIVTRSTRELEATRIVIAHRLSTVMDADRVIVLVDGQIAQDAPPGDLLADHDGVFYQLARRQLT